MSVAIHWFRRDLRLSDNTGFTAATSGHDEVVPVYILSDWQREHPWTGAVRQDFICKSLASLASGLEAIGGRLIIRQGRDQCAVLEELVRETGADAICYNRDPDPYGRAMEERIAAMAEGLGVAVHACKDHALHERAEVLNGSGEPFKIFGPYLRRWQLLEKKKPAPRITRIAVPAKVRSLPLPTLATWGVTHSAVLVEAGETAAQGRAHRFLGEPVGLYSTQRNLPASDGSSRLSQDLRWGLLSVRELYWRCQERSEHASPAEREHVTKFIGELAWREFAMQVLYHYPEILDVEYLPQFRKLPWRPTGEAHAAWLAGQTGFPIVDAGMRQLLATGFMHNRVRMVVAMFLCKDLHHSWRVGESAFMHHLVDGEIASNNVGWQWCASVGTDAQPYFRIQNPWSQTARHDPSGTYIKRWVPELRNVSPALLARVPRAGESVAAGYARPIVDHAEEREAALRFYKDGRVSRVV